MSQLRPELVEILACPACKSKVNVHGTFLVCSGSNCGLKFPIRDGIPVMLIDEAEKSGV